MLTSNKYSHVQIYEVDISQNRRQEGNPSTSNMTATNGSFQI